ncbi:MAG TPA: hypothetical protein HA222_01390 [Candidatus Diapherotrites archaeon]|uniref:Uncharacterized protein n=1 Tax=Candidatus Iainarchaeum sp. TaxID=3101447 RepID=A0A7J4JXA0_9ARCH|nr:hypothetical protein [Candidatus Diapherotrites archaeon]HIH33106.1 hypothetical protein [Candidatus Diapherotrites archaeon]
MPNLSISSSLFPYRLSLRQHSRLAGELTLELENKDARPKLLSFSLRLPDAVAFDRSGFSRQASKQLKALAPNSSQKLSFPVFLTQHASPGVFSGRLLVSEHSEGFEYPTASYEKQLSFRIID